MITAVYTVSFEVSNLEFSKSILSFQDRIKPLGSLKFLMDLIISLVCLILQEKMTRSVLFCLVLLGLIAVVFFV